MGECRCVSIAHSQDPAGVMCENRSRWWCVHAQGANSIAGAASPLSGDTTDRRVRYHISIHAYRCNSTLEQSSGKPRSRLGLVLEGFHATVTFYGLRDMHSNPGTSIALFLAYSA